MKIQVLNNSATQVLEREGRLRGVLADLERESDKLFGIKTYDGPVLFNHSGKVIPQTLHDRKEPWLRMKVDTGRSIVSIFTKGEIDDDE